MRRPTHPFNPWMLALVSVTACTKAAPQDSDTGDSAPPAPTEHCGTLTADETWTAAQNPHVVTCDIEIREATLRIEAGALVYLDTGTGIEVGDTNVPGTLELDGSADALVELTPSIGAVAGAWTGIVVRQEGSLVARYARIAGGGRGADSEDSANLRVLGAEALLEQVTLADSAGQGLILLEGGRLDPASAGLRVSGSAEWAVRSAAEQVHTLPAEGSDYTGNRHDGVAVEAGAVAEAVTWEDLGVPYDVLGNVRFDGLASSPAILTVGAGTTLRFDPGSGLRFSAGRGESGLLVGESGGETVTFTSLGATEPGWWAGLALYDGVQRVDIRNATLAYAEGEEGAALSVLAAVDVHLEGVEIADAGAVGLMLREGARLDAETTELRIHASGSYPMGVDADGVHSIPRADYLGNGRDAILVYGTEIPYAVSWLDHGLPYVVDGVIALEGVAAAPAVLSLEPGTELRFLSGSGLTLAADSNAAGLLAEGTSAAPIVFTAESAAQPGAWYGIAAYDGTTELRISEARIEWAGGGQTEAALYASDADLFLNNVQITGSIQDGLALREDARLLAGSGGLIVNDCERPITVSPRWVESIPTDTQLSGSLHNYIFINGDNFVSASTVWPLQSVDYWVEGIVPVGGGPQSVTLTLQPGVTLRFDNDAGLLIAEDLPAYPDANLEAVGTTANPITFTAARAYDRGAWAGVSIGQACGATNILRHVRIEYGGGDYQANLRIRDCDAILEDVTLEHSAGVGLQISGQEALVELQDVSIYDTVDRGMEVTGAQITLSNLRISYSLDDGLYLGPDVQLQGTGLTVQSAGGDGFGLADALVTLDNLTVQGSAGNGIHVTANTTESPQLFTGGLVTGNAGDGAHFDLHGDGTTFDGLAFENNAGWGVWWNTPTRRAPTLSSVTFLNNTLGDTP